MTAESAAEKPVSTLFSGPVGGLIGGIWVGRTAGMRSVISLDVGGTSADIGVAPDGRGADAAPARHEGRQLPRDDPDGRDGHDRGRWRLRGVRRAGGIFRVGPAAAGAGPRPRRLRAREARSRAATDAPPRLGRSGEGLLGGTRALDDTARAAIETRLCEPLGLGGGGLDARCRSRPTRWSSRSRRTPCARGTTRVTSHSSPRAGPARCTLRHRAGARNPLRLVPLSGDHLRDGPARHQHGLRVRQDGMALLHGRSPSGRAVPRARGAGGRPARRDGIPAERRARAIGRLPLRRTGL